MRVIMSWIDRVVAALMIVPVAVGMRAGFAGGVVGLAATIRGRP
jgi:hypothetical protein